MPAKHVAMHGAWPEAEADQEGPGHQRQMTRYATSSSGSLPRLQQRKGGMQKAVQSRAEVGRRRGAEQVVSMLTGADATGRSSPELPGRWAVLVGCRHAPSCRGTVVCGPVALSVVGLVAGATVALEPGFIQINALRSI